MSRNDQAGPAGVRPGGAPRPPTRPEVEVRPLVFTPEILAEAAAAPPPSPERLALVAALLGPHLPTSSARPIRAVMAE